MGLSCGANIIGGTAFSFSYFYDFMSYIFLFLQFLDEFTFPFNLRNVELFSRTDKAGA